MTDGKCLTGILIPKYELGTGPWHVTHTKTIAKVVSLNHSPLTTSLECENPVMAHL